MKKFFMLVMLLICWSRVTAGSIDKIIFFGDSLTDNGNLYRLLFQIVPKSPPYFKGRFSNGYVWSEVIGKYYYDKYYMDYQIYALGGSTAILHLPTSRFISPANLEIQVDGYLIDYFFSEKNKTLFTFWIGGNDYLYYQEADPDELTTKVVDKIAWGIRTLISYGARNFLVLNLPDLSKTPFAHNNGSIPGLHLITELHNQKLAHAIESLKATYPFIKILSFDAFDTFNDVMANPGKYNKKYNLNITNTTESCWRGGYLFRDSPAKKNLAEKIQKIVVEKNGSLPKGVDPEVMSNFIMSSPSLYHALSVGTWYDQGLQPCPNPNEYIFWDEMHPTQVVHRLMSLILIERLGSQIATR